MYREKSLGITKEVKIIRRLQDNKKVIPSTIPLWLKYLFALLPLIIIFKNIQLEGMIDIFVNTPWWCIPFFIVAILSSMFLQGVRWWMLLKAFIPGISFRKVINFHFVGIFYSIMLPTNAAGDFVRAALLSKGNDYSVIWGSSWICRILGILALCLLSVVGLFFIDRHSLPKGFFVVFCSVTALVVLIFFLSFSKKITRRFRGIVTDFLPKKISVIFENIRQAIYIYRGKIKVLLVVSLATLCFQLILICTTSVIIAGITGNFFLLECLVYIPPIEIITMSLPLTPNGLGIREALVTLMFNHIGLSKEQLGVYIMFGFLAYSLKLVGGIPVLWGFFKKNKASPPQIPKG